MAIQLWVALMIMSTIYKQYYRAKELHALLILRQVLYTQHNGELEGMSHPNLYSTKMP